VSRRQTPHRKRSNERERKALDRAVLRLTRSFYAGQSTLTPDQNNELFGLVRARRRVGE
jgi:hypothetical protein